MALVLAAVLALLIVEDAMPRRKTSPRQTDPAADALMKTLHPHAAGIDVGAAEMWVAVPPGSVPADSTPPGSAPPEFWRGEVADDTFDRVRRFGTFTADLQAIARWLRQCGVTTVAMESTGVYWIPLYDLLESAGFEVLLVDPRQTQRAPGRPKTDKHDSMWIQRLHGLGLLTAAFRPQEKVRIWRSYQRHRANLVADAARHLLRLQKALEQHRFEGRRHRPPRRHQPAHGLDTAGRRFRGTASSGEQPLPTTYSRSRCACRRERRPIAASSPGRGSMPVRLLAGSLAQLPCTASASALATSA